MVQGHALSRELSLLSRRAFSVVHWWKANKVAGHVASDCCRCHQPLALVEEKEQVPCIHTRRE